VPLRLLLILVLSQAAFAAQVTYVGPSGKLVAIEHDFPASWKLNEYACLRAPKDWDSKEAYVPDCGWIILTTRRGAVIKFEKKPDDMDVGREVERNANAPDKTNRTAENIRREVENKNWSEMISFYSRLGEGGNSAAAGGFSDDASGDFEIAKDALTVGLGISVFRPAGLSATSLVPAMKTNPIPSLLIVRMAQDAHTDFGLAVGFSSISDGAVKGKAISGMALYDYYPDRVYHGWWWQGAAGVSSTSNKGADGEAFSYIGIHAMGTFGRRFGGPPMNFGIGAGVHGLLIPTIPERNLKIIQLLPCLILDAAWTF